MGTKTSAGGVVYRKNGDEIEIILIKIRNGTVITLPKGRVNEGESLAETALREVREEAGINGTIEAYLEDVSYWFYSKEENVKYKKKVHYYLMRYVNGKTTDHDSEVEDVAWMNLEEAVDKVVYKTDRQILKKARKMLL
ncbi:putative mutator protein MutT4 [bacterium BMS3Abin07]|nr:putative mutator protein MutT4 [bacterium BMS3Abin07]GBE32569.1 putative mutator protein MutT4 [bacterium BMS3Bbin05]